MSNYDPFATFDDDLDDGAATLVDPAPERQPFVAGYDQGDARIFRNRLYADDGGVATVIFRGTITTEPWVEAGSSGRLSVYAEVTPTDTVDTVLQIALVPTGKRVPARGTRLKGGRRTQAYLLAADTQPRPVLATPAQDADDSDA